ncbi:unnamed protein product [Bursaphelenchus okinawaensis]|uniref:Uncharacterized protein n=1 Tax=Bursaphelenchus okinawaensis TaxID=465554 RepID=A0A811K5V3_9BILA|nr:unnamed protein product [Bursaphelenchus okinawaensis]CAG9093288.1 unnamed protein product [Bursaphelenchus okinawaensis]
MGIVFIEFGTRTQFNGRFTSRAKMIRCRKGQNGGETTANSKRHHHRDLRALLLPVSLFEQLWGQGKDGGESAARGHDPQALRSNDLVFTLWPRFPLGRGCAVAEDEF